MSSTLLWCVSLLISIALFIVEFFLSKKRNFLWGLLPILVIVITLSSIGVYATNLQSEYQIVHDSYSMENGTTAEIIIKQNEKKEVVAYSHLQIRSSAQEILDIAPLNTAEIGECRYKTAARFFERKHNLKNYSIPSEYIENNNIFFGDVGVDPNSFFTMAIGISIPLALFYGLSRFFRKKEQIKKELRKMNINFL